METCRTCRNNDDLLCDVLGMLIDDDDEACEKYEEVTDEIRASVQRK